MGNFWRSGPSARRLTDSEYSTLSIASESALQKFNIRRPPCRVLKNDELWDNVDQKTRICVVRKKVQSKTNNSNGHIFQDTVKKPTAVVKSNNGRDLKKRKIMVDKSQQTSISSIMKIPKTSSSDRRKLKIMVDKSQQTSSTAIPTYKRPK